MKKIMVVFGTRPEAIKMAPLCHKLKEQISLKTIVCVTGQHREMLDQVLEIFKLTPDIDLNIMRGGQDLFDITARILLAMKNVLINEDPDLVLVHGDTSTTYATSLACFYMGIKVGHIEAGLRTNDLQAPFPEEFNRQSTGIISNYHFTPTIQSKKNLINEGKDEKTISVTGNTVIDALHLVLDFISTNEAKNNEINAFLNKELNFNWKNDRFILITGHRRENFGKGFLDICYAIKELSLKHPTYNFVYPVHLNPNVQEPVNGILSKLNNVFLIEPLKYEIFIYLLKYSYIVLTDSGGIQEEAPSLGKPVLVMRDFTERPEAIEAGTVKLVGSSKENIVKNIDELIYNTSLHSEMSKAHNPYGDGHAS
ncbi:MAG: UDP-N-acetylglucosamine 2-epimerase (non-hydrolyzing), partial [Flavobacteriaceae bacterium]|nr:UDP-N-acetylglucosamine 2-epimerase (non-hydrolyzing) [Flavobacteriaceae bacterium]